MLSRKYLFILNNDGEGGLLEFPGRLDYPPQRYVGQTMYYNSGVMRRTYENESMIYTEKNCTLDLSLYTGEPELNKLAELSTNTTNAAVENREEFSFDKLAITYSEMMRKAEKIPTLVKIAPNVYDLLIQKAKEVISQDKRIEGEITVAQDWTLFGMELEIDHNLEPGKYKFFRGKKEIKVE